MLRRGQGGRGGGCTARVGRVGRNAGNASKSRSSTSPTDPLNFACSRSMAKPFCSFAHTASATALTLAAGVAPGASWAARPSTKRSKSASSAATVSGSASGQRRCAGSRAVKAASMAPSVRLNVTTSGQPEASSCRSRDSTYAVTVLQVASGTSIVMGARDQELARSRPPQNRRRRGRRRPAPGWMAGPVQRSLDGTQRQGNCGTSGSQRPAPPAARDSTCAVSVIRHFQNDGHVITSLQKLGCSEFAKCCCWWRQRLARRGLRRLKPHCDRFQALRSSHAPLPCSLRLNSCPEQRQLAVAGVCSPLRCSGLPWSRPSLSLGAMRC